METQNNYKKLVTAGVLFLSLASLLIAVGIVGIIKNIITNNHVKYTQANPPQISVDGTADVFVVPNIATFTYSVIETDTTVQAAQSKATDLSNKAIAYLKTAGVDEKDIKTTSYDITPQYEYSDTGASVRCFNCGKQTLVGYQVSQSVEVKIRKTDQAGTILAGIGSIGVQNVSGLTLTVDDQNAVMEQAREQAIADARSKAQKLAQDLGVHLGRVISFSDQSSGYPVVYSSKAMAAGAPTAAVAPEIPTGQNKVTSNVTVIYEIQ